MSATDGRRDGRPTGSGAGGSRTGAGRPPAGGGRGRAGGGRGDGPAGRGGASAGRDSAGGGERARPVRQSWAVGQSRPTRAAAPAAPARDVHVPDGVRLQKVLATAGLGSRRACEVLIEAGRVTVDGVQMRELGVRVDPQRAVIHVDGMRIQLDTSLVTIALNKPLGVVSTMHDPEGRPSLGQFVENREERLFHVGRLDAETEGLLLLTNDGDLANRLAHPSHGVPKTYLAQLDGRVPGSLAHRMLHGVELEDGTAKVDAFRVVDLSPQASLVEVVLHEGRNRIVRRMFDEVGFPVVQLVRTQIGPIKLGDLRPGRTRVLGQTELGTLMAQAGM